MPLELKNRRFVMFKNDDRQSEKDPNYSGELLIDGQRYYINLWRAESKRGNVFLSGTVKPKGTEGAMRQGSEPTAQTSQTQQKAETRAFRPPTNTEQEQKDEDGNYKW